MSSVMCWGQGHPPIKALLTLFLPHTAMDALSWSVECLITIPNIPLRMTALINNVALGYFVIEPIRHFIQYIIHKRFPLANVVLGRRM